MFDWLKSKKTAKEAPKSQNPKPTQSREDLVAGAMKNAQSAREALGPERLAQLNALLLKKQQEAEVSPAAQAKKIIAHMDKDKVGDFLKFVVQDNPTKH